MVKSFKLVVNDKEYTVEIPDLSQSPLAVVVNGTTYRVEVQRDSAKPASVVRVAEPKRKMGNPVATPKPEVEAPAVIAPLPCKVLGIKVKAGAQVKNGDVLFVVESMKMEIDILAPRDGVIKAIRVAEGQMVRQGEVLADLE